MAAEAAEAFWSTTDGGIEVSVDEAGSDDEGVHDDSGRRLAEVSGEGAGVGAEVVVGTAAGGATVVDDMCARTGAQRRGTGGGGGGCGAVGENGMGTGRAERDERGKLKVCRFVYCAHFDYY